MAANIERSFGLIYSQRVLLELVRGGLLREDAYLLVQRNAMRAWEEKRPFKDLLASDPEVAARLYPGRDRGPLRARLSPAQRGRDLREGGSVAMVTARVSVRGLGRGAVRRVGA